MKKSDENLQAANFREERYQIGKKERKSQTEITVFEGPGKF